MPSFIQKSNILDGNGPRYMGEHGTSDSFFFASSTSELSCFYSMHLCDSEKKSKGHDDRGKDKEPHWPDSSRVQKLCRALAFLIVFRLFCV